MNVKNNLLHYLHGGKVEDVAQATLKAANAAISVARRSQTTDDFNTARVAVQKLMDAARSEDATFKEATQKVVALFNNEAKKFKASKVVKETATEEVKASEEVVVTAENKLNKLNKDLKDLETELVIAEFQALQANIALENKQEAVKLENEIKAADEGYLENHRNYFELKIKLLNLGDESLSELKTKAENANSKVRSLRTAIDKLNDQIEEHSVTKAKKEADNFKTVLITVARNICEKVTKTVTKITKRSQKGSRRSRRNKVTKAVPSCPAHIRFFVFSSEIAENGGDLTLIAKYIRQAKMHKVSYSIYAKLLGVVEDAYASYSRYFKRGNLWSKIWTLYRSGVTADDMKFDIAEKLYEEFFNNKSRTTIRDGVHIKRIFQRRGGKLIRFTYEL